jgi:hypothetical protein
MFSRLGAGANLLYRFEVMNTKIMTGCIISLAFGDCVIFSKQTFTNTHPEYKNFKL